MDYQYENLDENRFQHFCQSLLIAEFPELQCFPIGQPDGGRDAIVYMEREQDEFIVFQVKYVRNPQSVKDPHKWLIGIMKGEAPKVERLIPRGAVKYYLLTNVAGTAHQDAGSIDKLQKIINTSIEIPGQCWWRDDLNRRLDTLWDLKWSYPEVLSGKDILGIVISEGLNEAKEKRETAIRNYVKKQYEQEKDVKFKQIDLTNKITEIFVDVPIIRSDFSEGYRRQRSRRSYDREMRELLVTDAIIDDEIRRQIRYELHQDEVGAAELLLLPVSKIVTSHIVIEGAPGQGKSTITQYICQVYRTKILNKDYEFRHIASKHQIPNLKIPIKVDLRDLAVWLGKENPFIRTKTREVPGNWKPSLESFLAAQISYLSGGLEFEVSDLYAIVKISSILIVLDALDEVPDRESRKELVEVVEEGIDNLSDHAASMQVIITSRPAAFANSPGFSPSKFEYYELSALTREHIEEYAEKWIKARRVDERSASDIRMILREKLSEPHLRDLSRNPMQLAILLTLIYSRGASLPDKRTALYDAYVDIFFNREVEKSQIVRDFRTELIGIHQYLGWLLHSEAELGANNGAITDDRLLNILREYLSKEGFNADIADDLFTGTIQRVGALVSRLEGTFEFEVQPLREYFAARYLYETAPYSPSGSEAPSGTKVDRFEAISRNFYWLNVTRFFAGCFSTGELAALVEMLDELMSTSGYKLIRHPRDLAVILLSDWVFAQQPRTMKRLVKILLEDRSFRLTLPTRHLSLLASRNSNILILQPEKGRKDLVEHCFRILFSRPPNDLFEQLTILLSANEASTDYMDVWLNYYNDIHDDETKLYWFRLAAELNILKYLPSDIREHGIIYDEVLFMIWRKANSDTLHSERNYSQRIFNYISNNYPGSVAKQVYEHGTILHHPINLFLLLIQNFTTSIRYMKHRDGVMYYRDSMFLQYDKDMLETNIHIESEDSTELEPLQKQITKLNRELLRSLDRPFESAEDLLTLHRQTLELLSDLVGESWLYYFVVTRISRNYPKSLTADASSDNLNARDQDIIDRILSAQKNKNSVKWWRKQIGLATSSEDKIFVSLMLLNITTIRVITTLAKDVGKILHQLSSAQWAKYWHLVPKRGIRFDELDKMKTTKVITDLPDELGWRIIACIGLTMNAGNTKYIYNRYLKDYDGDDLKVLELQQKAAIILLLTDESLSQEYLEVISLTYTRGVLFSGFPIRHKTDMQDHMSVNTAKTILTTPNNFPMYLVELAEIIYRQEVMRDIEPVIEIALRDNWAGA